MLNPVPAIFMLLGAVAGWLLFGQAGMDPSAVLKMAGTVGVAGLIGSAFRIAAQWERAMVFRLGRYQSTRGPGLFAVLPFFDSVRSVDTRIQTISIPTQQAITKDNVPVTIDGVIFLRVVDPEHALTRVQNYTHAMRQYAQTALRDIIGALTLDQVLADREEVGHKIEQMVTKETEGWGLEVAAIRIQDLILPEDLKRVMARQASAEREKRANITKSEGDREAAENLAAAAFTMTGSPGALQLRTLQTLDSLGSSAANTVVLAVPVEVLGAAQQIQELAKSFVSVQKKETAPKKVEDASIDRERVERSAGSVAPETEELPERG